MRKRMTLDQYVSAPLTKDEVAHYVRRERIKAIPPFVIAAIVFAIVFSVGSYNLPSDVMVAIVGSFISWLLTTYAILNLTLKNDFKITNEPKLTTEFMFSSSELYDNKENLVIPDVQRLLANVKALDRNIVELESNIVSKLFCEQIELKTKELFAPNSKMEFVS